MLCIVYLLIRLEIVWEVVVVVEVICLVKEEYLIFWDMVEDGRMGLWRGFDCEIVNVVLSKW